MRRGYWQCADFSHWPYLAVSVTIVPCTVSGWLFMMCVSLALILVLFVIVAGWQSWVKIKAH